MPIVADARPLADDIGRRTQGTKRTRQALAGGKKDEDSTPACLTVDPELFFPARHDGPFLDQIEEAKAVCRRCPLVEACLAGALARGEEFGIWGGLSEVERRAVKRAQAREQRVATEVAA